MSFTCLWRFLLLITTIIAVVQTEEESTDKTLYCIQHQGQLHKLGTCTSSKNKPISAAALTSNSNKDTTTTTTTTTNKISFDLTCKSDATTCEGVSATFSKATDAISSVFQFETPLLINATYLDFCQEYKDCGYDGEMISIGQAYPAISYVMVDESDNMTRMYPQPLLKQFTTLSVKPTWTKYDINAQFNNQMNWYFVNNPNPINSNQTDFLRNVIHELIHGLGFITSWSDDVYIGIAPLFGQELQRFITPILLASTDNDQLLDGYDAPQPFWGFVEFPFDKFVYYKTDRFNFTSGKSFSFTSITKKLNEFCNSNVIFRNLIDMANTWYNSTSYSEATEIYNRTITSVDVLAIINQEPILWLETSVNPYSTGSSLCHVDQSQYLNSTEYLMVYTANRGVGITELNQLFPNGPIGPKLQTIMASLGYRIQLEGISTIRPNLTYWSPPPGLVGTNTNPFPSLTINTDGPAHSPNITASSTTSSVPTSSSRSKVTSNAIITATFLYYYYPIILLLSFLIY